MAKRKPIIANAKKEARRNTPPRLQFRQNKDDLWVPIVTIANIVMPLEPRPFMGFHKGERDAILTWIKQAMSEILFDCPRYLVNEETGKSAVNPDWDLLPYYEQVELEPLPENVIDTRPVTFREVKPVPKPTAAQQKASLELPDET